VTFAWFFVGGFWACLLVFYVMFYLGRYTTFFGG
jgi:hypothetical protein